MSVGYGEYGLETIRDGIVPVTRMKSGAQVQDFVRRLKDNDAKRNFKRSYVNGIVDGNPPYRQSKLVLAGRPEACNVNWGTGRTYLEAGTGAFYDLSSQAPGFVSIRTSFGNAQQREDWSRIMSAKMDLLFATDPVWDFQMQVSQNSMVLHGRGPLIFEDPFSVWPRAVNDGDLKVPERTRADTHYWEASSVDIDYYPPEVYDFIRVEGASAAGWFVDFTEKVISNAMDVRQPDGRMYDWEFYQQELKNNSLSYYDDSKVCHLAHVFWKEFDGRITHAIVERENTAESEAQYLFLHVGRYENFRQCIHPMYFDRGNGGFHHSVTGLGVKMAGPMAYENRLLCNQMDKAFAPKCLFRPTTTESSIKFQLATHGDWGLVPPGYDVVQMPIQGLLTDGLAMYRTSSELIKSNLSSYRQQVPAQESGNPPTKYQKQLEAGQQSSLSNTTYNRYYKQLDLLYAEMVRRAANINSSNEVAQKWQKWCRDEGVPEEAFGRIEQVTAVRVIGQGSPFMRREAVNEIGAIINRLPEDGQMNWTNDYIAATAGHAAIDRYNPPRNRETLPSDQQAEALQWVATMKVGVQPIITPSMNSMTYAATFLTAAVQALNSVKQGANPAEVVKFLDIVGPAIGAHIQRFGKDPLRKQIAQRMTQQWQQLEQLTNQLKKQVQAMMKKQQQQQAKTAQVLSDQQLAQLETGAKIADRARKTQADLQLKAAKTRHQLALNDASTASNIMNQNRLKAFTE